MSYLFVLLLAVCFLTGCKADEVIVTQTETRTVFDTLRQVVNTRDSIYLHDSIFVLRETLPAAEPSGRDTLREVRYVYRYKFRDRQAKDSVRVVHETDTILVKEPDLHAIQYVQAQADKYKAQRQKWKLYFYLLALVTTAGGVLYVRHWFK